jgi:ABC-type dipeptide/oligopeptide/nickel transport system ATPase subunit
MSYQRPILGEYNVYDSGYFSEENYLLNKTGKKVITYRCYDFLERNKVVDIYRFVELLQEAGFHDINIFKRFTGFAKKDGKYSLEWTIFINNEAYLVPMSNENLKDLSKPTASFGAVFAEESGSIEVMQKIFEISKAASIDIDYEAKRYINIVGRAHRGAMTLKEHEIKSPKIPDLDLYYGQGFKEKHERFVEQINSKQHSGLFILHGISGSGKTNYIRYLINQVQPEIDFIFYPISLLRDITSPDLLTFLTDFPDSVLVIEESEDSIQSREINSTDKASVANLLNISDGLLSDALNLKIICTFNTDIRNLDPALLREGRLLGIHKFEKLSPQNANKIAEVNKLEKTFSESVTLAQVFNKRLKSDLSDFMPETKKIGF